MFTLSNCLVLSAALFSIGVYGVLARRNLLFILMSIELILNGAALAIVAASRWHADPSGHAAVLMALAVAAAEAAVGLAIVIAVYRHLRSVDADQAEEMRG